MLAEVTFAMSEKDPALLLMKAVVDNYSLHRNMRLDFINGKPQKAVEHLCNQAGHPQDSGREQTSDGHVGIEKGIARVR
jgi:hypothetical protein